MTTTTWNIDSTHSSIGFSVRHMVFARVRGQFKRYQGRIEMDPENLAAASVEVAIEAVSIDTGAEQRDEHLRSADFLDVATYPEIRFRSTRVVKNTDDKLEVHGDLTIRDVTRAVVLDTHFLGLGQDPWGNQRAGFSASTELLRSDFGLTWNQALEAGGVLVGDKLELTFDVEAVQAEQAQVA